MPRIVVVKTLAAFLDLVACSEGTSTSNQTHDDGYDIIVSGIDGPHTSSDYSAHPFAAGRDPIVVRAAKPPTTTTRTDNAEGLMIGDVPILPALRSTASGRYQITLPTWNWVAETRGLTTFSPQNQDSAAVELLTQCHAVDLISAGKIQAAIEAACETWASFPGNSYIQGGRPLAWLLQKYATLLNA